MSQTLNTINGDHQDDLKEESPKQLIPELCKQFYTLGWVSGTGGGLAINHNGRIYCAPSSVQKERIKPQDIFVLDKAGNIIERPKNEVLKCSECLSLFMVTFNQRDAKCCIHNHSIYANLVTALACAKSSRFQLSTETASCGSSSLDQPIAEFTISHQEMIKGIKKGGTNVAHLYTDTIVVPIIDNVLHERDLAESMEVALKKYPLTNAVLVRNHGVYVWGYTWQQAKSMAECYDYLFRIKIETERLGIN